MSSNVAILRLSDHPDRRPSVNDPRVLAAEWPLRRLLPAVALALSAALVVGSAAHAQDDATEPAGIDGTWLVDTSIGGFAEDLRSGSWVGFRVAEVLSPGGDVQAIGRTPLVSGQLTASGAVIESALIEADLTGIVSDRPRREDAIQRSLGTSDFPTASFVAAEPVDLGAVPVDGEPFRATVPGTLTIRDVSQEVTLELEGQRVGDRAVVVGTLPVDFTSFDVTMPSAPIVVSVEGSGDLEWQLFLALAAEADEAVDGEGAPDGEAGEGEDGGDGEGADEGGADEAAEARSSG
jgi:polyisoprenoid-binding protein YceI